MGKRLVMFIDDLNMPRVDLYGTQQPIALLKLFVERKGLYDRGKELGWKHMKDVQVAGAMGPPGGARNPVDPRFMSLFNVFEIQFPSNDNLRTIYQVSEQWGEEMGGGRRANALIVCSMKYSKLLQNPCF